MSELQTWTVFHFPPLNDIFLPRTLWLLQESGGAVYTIYIATHACDGRSNKWEYVFPHLLNLTVTAAVTDPVGQALQSCPCSLCQSCTWVWVSCHFAVYNRVVCSDITVHIQALLADSSPSLAILLFYACACVVYATEFVIFKSEQC